MLANILFTGFLLSNQLIRHKEGGRCKPATLYSIVTVSNGKSTTKYTVKTSDELLNSIINEIFSAGGQFGTMNQMPSISSLEDIIIVYVDGQGQIVKQQVQAEMNGTIPDLQIVFKVNVTGDIEYFNIGKPVTITAPAI